MGRDNWQTTLMEPSGSGLKNWDAISANEWGSAAILVNFHAAIQWLNRKRAIGFAESWEEEKGMTEIEKGSKGLSTCTNCCRGRHRICIAGQVEGSFKVASIKLLCPVPRPHTQRVAAATAVAWSNKGRPCAQAMWSCLYPNLLVCCALLWISRLVWGRWGGSYVTPGAFWLLEESTLSQGESRRGPLSRLPFWLTAHCDDGHKWRKFTCFILCFFGCVRNAPGNCTKQQKNWLSKRKVSAVAT